MAGFVEPSNKIASIPFVPGKTKVFSARSGVEGLRSVPRNRSLHAAIDGGNFLSNGAQPGARRFLVGMDSVALTQEYLRRQGQDLTDAQVMDHIRDQMHLEDGDRAIFVEQTSYHIDMTMMFTGKDEVVVNDSRGVFQLTTPGRLGLPVEEPFGSLGRIEDHVEQTLTDAGITVHRKPWMGPELNTVHNPSSLSFSFFNGELVKQHAGATRFITNWFHQHQYPQLPLSADAGTRLVRLTTWRLPHFIWDE